MVTRGNSPLTIGNDDDRFAAARCIDEEQASQGVQTLDRRGQIGPRQPAIDRSGEIGHAESDWVQGQPGGCHVEK